MDDKEYIVNSIKGTIQVPDNVADEVAGNLIREGLDRNLLTFSKEEDLMQAGLNRFQARAMIHEWSKALGEPDLHPNRDATDAEPSTSTALSNFLPSGLPIGFRIKWEPIYELQAVYNKEMTYARVSFEKGGRLNPELRKVVVAEVVRQTVKQVPNATRKLLERVYEILLAKHRSTFEETLGKGTICPSGILYQLKNKLDNNNRADRTSRGTETPLQRLENPRGKFSYACSQWRKKDLPLGETAMSQEETKTKLSDTFNTVRAKCWKWDEINTMMEKTYKSQRDMINHNIEAALSEKKQQQAKKRKRNSQGNNEQENTTTSQTVTITDIFNEWPFLFTYNGMLQHFQILTRVDLEKELDTFNTTEKSPFLQFFKSAQKTEYDKILKKVEKHKENYPDAELMGIVLLLSKFMTESCPIILNKEEPSLNDLEKRPELPVYPTIIASGKNLYKAKKYFFAVDQAFYYVYTDFKRAFYTLFMAYYVFNMNYAPNQQALLEFVQRCILHMDPVQGNKRPASRAEGGHYSSSIVHPLVARLHKNIKKVELRVDSSDSSSDVDQPDEARNDSDC